MVDNVVDIGVGGDSVVRGAWQYGWCRNRDIVGGVVGAGRYGSDVCGFTCVCCYDVGVGVGVGVVVDVVGDVGVGVFGVGVSAGVVGVRDIYVGVVVDVCINGGCMCYVGYGGVAAALVLVVMELVVVVLSWLAFMMSSV